VTFAADLPVIHRHVGGDTDVLANAYLIETEKGVIAVDATMTIAESEKLRAELESLHKPLLAVLITHGHPDHYGGITGLVKNDKVPIISSQEVDRMIRRDDAAKGQALKAAGIKWAEPRTFPNTTLESGKSVTFGGLRFTVYDAGAGESHADSYWIMEDTQKVAFVGDLALNHVNAFLADGHSKAWLQKLPALKTRLQTLGVTKVYPGHGDSGGLELFDWTRAYVERYRTSVKELAPGQPALTLEQKAELSRRMALFLPENKVPQFVTRSADAVAAELAKEAD
jgi:glyoxylase-like metal-dependent hydrolase (beta-lactamase superfamily II)